MPSTSVSRRSRAFLSSCDSGLRNRPDSIAVRNQTRSSWFEMFPDPLDNGHPGLPPQMRGGRRRGAQPGGQEDPLGGLPAALPALAAAYRQTMRAADLGFDWERDTDVVAKIEEELEEWRQARAGDDTEAESREIGDLLLSVVNLARRRRIDPESALRRANRRFRDRFAEVARKSRDSGRDVSEVPMAELDGYWEEAKKGL